MRTLLFDADCAMCQRAVQQLAHLKLLLNTNTQSWQQAASENPRLGSDPVLARRIQTELLLVDNEQVFGGFYAIAELLKTRFPQSRPLLNQSLLLKLGQTAYSVISYNRRILSPVGPIACQCDPPFHLGYWLSFWMILFLLSVFSLLTFGSSLRPVAGSFPASLFVPLALIALCGVAASLLILLLPVFYRRLSTLLPQLLFTLSLGAISLFPLAILNGIALAFNAPSQWTLTMSLLGLLFPIQVLRSTLSARCQRLGFAAWTHRLWLTLLLAGFLVGLALFWP